MNANHIRVLVVDDSAVVRKLISDALAVDPEIEVAPARTQVPHLLEQIRRRAEAGGFFQGTVENHLRGCEEVFA